MPGSCEKVIYQITVCSCAEPRVKSHVLRRGGFPDDEKYWVIWPNGRESVITKEFFEKYFGGQDYDGQIDGIG